ncbi:MAG: DUF2281 domain-containing protein [Oscillospiraceae bacterium]|nr:DUF2281 domain-containing protein [Oscillospiraceae bacterium]
MQAHVYEGYYEDGSFHPVDRAIHTRERKRAFLTVFEDPAIEQQPQPKKNSREALAGCMRGKVWMADDFDAPLEDFKDYM